MTADEPILKLREGEVVWRKFNDEAVLLDLRTSAYLATNPAATVLWRCLDQGATRSGLIDTLVQTYEIPVERATADVDAFLADCRQRGLLDGDPQAG